ncbi:MAG: flagellar basal body rod protein FlgB [Syntrophobacteraceae bacterium]
MSESSIVFDRTVKLMQDRLSLNSLNQKIISGNMANINTPGFKAKETQFEDVLRQSLEEHSPQLVRCNAKHMDPLEPAEAMRSAELIETGPVDLDNEMMKLSKNSIEYQFMVTMLNKKFNMLKVAIGEGA